MVVTHSLCRVNMPIFGHMPITSQNVSDVLFWSCIVTSYYRGKLIRIIFFFQNGMTERMSNALNSSVNQFKIKIKPLVKVPRFSLEYIYRLPVLLIYSEFLCFLTCTLYDMCKLNWLFWSTTTTTQVNMLIFGQHDQ